MNILMLSHNFPTNTGDSSGRFIFDLAAGLLAIGQKVSVVIPDHPDFSLPSNKSLAVDRFRYFWPRSFQKIGFGRSMEKDQTLRPINYILILPYLFFSTLKTVKIIKQRKIDQVSAHWLIPNGLVALIASLLTHTPYTISLAGSDVFLVQKNQVYGFISKLIIKNAAQIISNSPQLLKDLGVKGSVISYPVPINQGVRPKKRGLVIATAGRPVEKKGFQLLNSIKDLEIIHGLSIYEFRKKLLCVDIFIAPSIRDSVGNLDDASLVVLEAMGAGCAVICSDLPGYRQIIKSGQNGLIVNVSNPNEIISATNKLRRSAILRLKLGNNARNTVVRLFNPEAIAQKYLKIFSSVPK